VPIIRSVGHNASWLFQQFAVNNNNNNNTNFQRISVVVQRFNGVLLHDSFCVEDQPD